MNELMNECKNVFWYVEQKFLPQLSQTNGTMLFFLHPSAEQQNWFTFCSSDLHPLSIWSATTSFGFFPLQLSALLHMGQCTLSFKKKNDIELET